VVVKASSRFIEMRGSSSHLDLQFFELFEFSEPFRLRLSEPLPACRRSGRFVEEYPLRSHRATAVLAVE
jgi:hypothetical protein